MGQNLILRITTGILAVPVLFLVIHLGGWAFTTWVSITVLLGAWEWWRLRRAIMGLTELILLAAGALAVLCGGIDPRPERLVIALGLWFVCAALCGLRHNDGYSARRLGHMVLGLLYIGLLPSFLIQIRAFTFGREALYLVYLSVFLCDTMAYFIGKTVGRHRLWPRISPKKTWEGAFGGLAGALIASIGGSYLFAEFFSPMQAIGFGLIVGILAQLGDLVESHWKREAEVKDSSSILPGHGGILDRFDGLHFIAPVLFIYLMLSL